METETRHIDVVAAIEYYYYRRSRAIPGGPSLPASPSVLERDVPDQSFV
jgi:hypothetical protein